MLVQSNPASSARNAPSQLESHGASTLLLPPSGPLTSASTGSPAAHFSTTRGHWRLSRSAQRLGTLNSIGRSQHRVMLGRYPDHLGGCRSTYARLVVPSFGRCNIVSRLMARSLYSDPHYNTTHHAARTMPVRTSQVSSAAMYSDFGQSTRSRSVRYRRTGPRHEQRAAVTGSLAAATARAPACGASARNRRPARPRAPPPARWACVVR